MSALKTGARAFACALLLAPFAATAEEADDGGRRIEEITVTAEKRESTVSDTSISITAFGEDMIEDFGLQGADELVNFIPATTRDAYDIRIRGVGRNFRALGGDPGVATYYNGVYSEDFGIAASENGLYDVQRIEVLRGPQGTLYGRNSIGGALNYITNRPTMDLEGEVRTIQGSLGTNEYYGVLSGPIIADRLAYRFTGVKRDRDPSIDGMNGSPGINSIDDQNLGLSLEWIASDTVTVFARWNDRSSDRIIGGSIVLDQGVLGDRGRRNVDNYARGVVPTAAGTPGAFAFPHPNGTTLYGRLPTPGVDRATSTVPNAGFGLTGLEVDTDLDNLNNRLATNGDNHEQFDQNAVQFEIAWDLSETTTLKYLGGWMDFDYTFDIDLDNTNGTFAQPRSTVLEAVETYSHELQLLWQLGDNLELTSGVYFFNSDRLQNFAFRDLHSQGRFVNPVNYGGMAGFLPFVTTGGALSHVRRGDAPVGTQVLGIWEGDPTGAYYEYWNTVETDATAVYTQGTYTFNEEWALVVGLRWAEDEKTAFEDRTGYFELNPAVLGPFIDGACDGVFGFDCTLIGLTSLAVTNVFMGNAAPTFNPAAPIAPACGLTDPNCATPLRLQGIPFSFSDRAAGDDDWGDTSWRVNLDWTPTEDLLIYFSATTGYRAGGYSLGIGDSRGTPPGGLSGIEPSAYDQEEVIAYEIGYKGLHFDGQLQLNASMYRYSYDNYQDRINVYNETLGGSQDQVRNAEEAENTGFELEVLWLATDALTVGMNGSLTSTEYKSDQLQLETDNPAYPTTIFNDSLDRDNFLVRNLNGNDLKRIPEKKYTFWASYQWQFDNGTLTAGATHSYTGEYQSDGIVRFLDKVPARRRTDIRLTWRESTDRWVVSAFVDNVFDDVNLRGLGTGGIGGDFTLTGASLYPRFAGLEATYRFGPQY